MRHLNFFIYTISGTLLLCTPFTTDLTLVNGLVIGKVHWIQLVLLIFSIGILFFSFIEKEKRSLSFNWEDAFLLTIIFWYTATYRWHLNPEPQKLAFAGQITVLWFIISYSLKKYPILNHYFLLVLISTGFIEAIWGIRQLYGWSYSNHSLFRLTGSFFNPGPYSGYLSIILPISLGLLLKQSSRNIVYYFAITCILAIILVLPAGKSRSAWIAATFSCFWVYIMYRLNWEWVKKNWIQYKKRYLISCIIGYILLFGGFSYLYTFKKDSADGRFLMWKITAKAIQKQPFTGTGLGGFPAAYAETQAEYMTSGKATEREKLVAGCPEYAFNEYLQIGLEQGIWGLFLFIIWLVIIFYKGIKNKRYACCGGIIALAIFAFSSYPLQLPEFWVILIFLGVMCITPNPNQRNKPEPNRNEWYKQIFLIGVAILGIIVFWEQKDYYKAYQK